MPTTLLAPAWPTAARCPRLLRLDLLTDNTARITAVLVAVLQLFVIGAFVARVAPPPPAARWTVAAATAGIGVAVGSLTVLLGH